MTMNHRDLLRKRYPQYSNKIYMLGEYAGTVCCSGDIPDPFGLPLDTVSQNISDIGRICRKFNGTSEGGTIMKMRSEPIMADTN
jgi:hypothetical protein